ncbi:MAG: hypothetical protein ACM3SM_02605 [Bacteroidota bacterium]
MRLLKNTNYEIEPFHSSLQFQLSNVEKRAADSYSLPAQQEATGANLLEKYSHFIQNLVSFEKLTSAENSSDVILDHFRLSVRRIIPAKEAGIFLLDESKSHMIPVDPRTDKGFVQMVNNIYKESIIDWIFENARPSIFPDMNNYTVSGSKLNFILIPIIEGGSRKGILAVLTPYSKADIHELELQSIQVLLNLSLAKIEKNILREKLNRTYNELQTYQAKLSNDYRLSAIGELTEGIVEDIKSPLQVILSYADIISGDDQDNRAAGVVKEQVKKINFVINRLVKFSNINEDKMKIFPCDINQIVAEYHNLIKSSLDNAGIECLLDFEREIPSVLSHPNYIFQLLSNLMNIIKSKSGTSGGGIIIQTRYSAENIIIKIINTAQLSPYKAGMNSQISSPANLNFRIIENIMKLHEGEFAIENFQKSSSIIILRFPLRRKIRQ